MGFEIIRAASIGLAAATLLLHTPASAQQPQPPVLTPPRPIASPLPILAPPPVPGPITPARPIGNPATWVNVDDYPQDAQNAGIEGTVGFRLSIDRSGNVDGCAITSSSGYLMLDDLTCQLLTKRAKFTPARDANGRFLPGSYASRVRWVQPGESEVMVMDRAPQQGQVVIEYLVGTDGVAHDCKVVSGADLFDLLSVTTPCAWKMRYPPYHDAAGKLVEKRVRLTVTVSFPGTAPAPRKRRGK